MPEIRLLDNQSTTCVTLQNVDEVVGKNFNIGTVIASLAFLSSYLK